ncbi:unnamed protein product [Penicillium bialowiezense]
MPGIMDRNQNGYVLTCGSMSKTLANLNANAQEWLYQDVRDLLEVRPYRRAAKPVSIFLGS